ncbi:DUF551 domain-containing protein [Klebsiella michiganensis]
MTRSTLTRERIELIANFHRAMTLPPSHAEIEELARMALAAMDSEPVGSISIDRLLQLLYQFDGANECAASIGDQEYALECGDVASALRELLSCRSALPVADVVAWSNPNEERKCDIRWRRHDVEPGPLYRHAQPAPVVPGWIPVSERMPDNTEPVLCIEKRADFGTYGQPFVCWHDGGGWVGKTNYRPIVTHWMPLPAGPQGVKGE